MAQIGLTAAVFLPKVLGDGTLEPSVTFTDEATTANATRTEYQITAATKRYWDKSVAVTVKVNAVTVSPDQYVIQHAGGVVVFAVARGVGAVVIVSGKSYANMIEVAGFYEWSFDAQKSFEEYTNFGSQGWEEVLPLAKSWKATAQWYWADKRFFDALDQGWPLVAALYLDKGTAKTRLEGAIEIESVSFKSPTKGIVKETINLRGSGAFAYRAG